MNPQISIITPVYNVEQYIEKCIDSILAQTFTDFELILVDDGTKDDSGVICDRYAEQDNRIRVIHKQNGGLSSARNAGLDIARGEYIGFIDSDDWIDKDMFSILHKNAITTNADIAVCNIEIITQSEMRQNSCKEHTDILFDRDQAMNELYNNSKLTYSACNKLYKKFLFNNQRYKEGIIFEDMDASYKIINMASKVHYTSKPLYFYRYNDSSILRKEFDKRLLIEFEIKTDMYNFYLEQYPQFSNEVYAERYLTGIILYLKMNKYHRELVAKYDYLIKADKQILATVLKQKKYPRKKRFLISLSLMLPKLFFRIYSYYLDKVKNLL